MMEERRSPRPDEDPARLQALLDLGMRGPTRVVDRLIDQVLEAKDESWVNQFLDRMLVVVGCCRDDLLLPTPLESLVSLKQRCRNRFEETEVSEDRVAAVTAYYLSLAAGAVHHRKKISSRSPEEVASVLADLGATLPAPWGDLAVRGAHQIEQRPEGD